MQFEIVLKADQKTLPIREIPALIASAMHPEPPEGRSESYLSLLAEAENEHRSALMGSVRYGFLTILSAKTNQPTDENNPLAMVPIEAFTKYVEQFNIDVRVVDDSSATP